MSINYGEAERSFTEKDLNNRMFERRKADKIRAVIRIGQPWTTWIWWRKERVRPRSMRNIAIYLSLIRSPQLTAVNQEYFAMVVKWRLSFSSLAAQRVFMLLHHAHYYSTIKPARRRKQSIAFSRRIRKFPTTTHRQDEQEGQPSFEECTEATEPHLLRWRSQWVCSSGRFLSHVVLGKSERF